MEALIVLLGSHTSIWYLSEFSESSNSILNIRGKMDLCVTYEESLALLPFNDIFYVLFY